MTKESEIRILKSCANGDAAAFEPIVHKYQSLVCAITYSAVGQVEKSEELAQQVFINAWKGLGTLKDLANFKVWLVGITRNVIRDWFRRQKRDIVAQAASIDEIGEAADESAEPLEAIITKEQEAIVQQSLQQIPEKYREPMVLFYRQQQSTRQVAEALEISEEAVRTRLMRGRQMLKDQVARMVESTLSHSGPGKAFTTMVVASIAGLALTSATASAATGTTAAGTSTAASSAGSSGLAALTTGITAKIITAAVVIAVGVGAGFVYKHLSKSEQPTKSNETVIVQDQQKPIVTPEKKVDALADAQEPVIENPDTIATAVGGDSIAADNSKTEASLISTATGVAGSDEYVFEPNGVLSGLITDKDTGEPVAGAEIVIYGVSIPNGRLVTDVNGFYCLENIKNSKLYEIAITSEDYVGKPNLDDDYKIAIEKDKQQIAHFQLEKACIADLWVRDEQGKPIKGAEIKVVDLVTNRSTVASRSNIIKPTDKDGYTLIGGHPALKSGYMVMVTHEGRTGNLIASSEGCKYHETKPDFAPAHIIVENTDPDIVPAFDVTMKKGKMIKGYIEYSDGVPASDLKIVSVPDWWSKTNLSGERTGISSDGSFVLEHITPEKYCISAYYPVEGSYKAIETIDFAHYDGDLHFTLSEPSPQSLLSIKGTVKVIKIAPVGNLYINVDSYNTSTNTHGSRTSIWNYDENDEAKFEINRLKGGNYRLTFQSEHFETVVLEDIKPPVDDLYIEMEQIVKPEISVMVVDKETGKPIKSMKARLIKNIRRSGNPYGVTDKWLERSNPQGRAVFTVTHGVYQVQIMAEGYALGVSDEIDTGNLKLAMITLTKGGTIKGCVINSDGKPVAGAEILALSYAGGDRMNSTEDFISKTKAVFSDIDGNFVIENLPEGLETIKVDHKDYSPVIVSDIAVVNGKVSEEMIIELGEAAIIDGYVFDNDGKKIAGARLDYDQNRERVIMQQNTGFVVTDPNGYYRIEGLGENPCFIARNRGSFTEGVSCRTVTPICGEVTELNFGGDGYAVTGSVVVDDIPSGNLKLALRDKSFDGFLSYTTTDSNGNFVFTGIVKGEYNIRAVDDFNTMFTCFEVVDTDVDLGVIGNNLVDFEVIIESHGDWKNLQQVVIIQPPTYALGQQRDEIDKQNRLWRFVNIVPDEYDLRIYNDKATSFKAKVNIEKGQTELFKITPPKLDAALVGNFYRSISKKSIPQYLLLSNDSKTVSAYLIPQKDGAPDDTGEFEVKLPAGQYQINYIDGKDQKLLKEFEIVSGQHMRLEIDIDAVLK